MGAELDLDDVAATSPLAKRQLDALRAHYAACYKALNEFKPVDEEWVAVRLSALALVLDNPPDQTGDQPMGKTGL